MRPNIIRVIGEEGGWEKILREKQVIFPNPPLRDILLIGARFRASIFS